MPREVILALVLVDLPVDLDEKEDVKVREGHGGSWWFLACESDDQYVDILEEVISVCSYLHLRELCFMKGGPNRSEGNVISKATPRCREALRRALRFVGRFELLGGSALYSDSSLGLVVFDALDFGADHDSKESGQRMLLRCYDNEESCLQEVRFLVPASC